MRKKIEKFINKRMFLGVLIAIFTFSVPVEVAAASGINAQEQRLLDYGTAQAKRLKLEQHPEYQKYMAQARNYLLRDDVDLTVEEVEHLLKTAANVTASVEQMLNGNAQDTNQTNKETQAKSSEKDKATEKDKTTGKDKDDKQEGNKKPNSGSMIDLVVETLDTINPILQEAGIVISEDAVGGLSNIEAQLVQRNEDGSVKGMTPIISMENVIKNTGLNMNTAVLTAIIMLALLTICGIISVKWLKENKG